MQYQVNKPIPLAQTHIRFDVGGQYINTPAEATLHLLPRPRLKIKCEFDLKNWNIKVADILQSYITATILEQEAEFIVGQFTFPWNPTESQSSMTLSPNREPLSIRYTGESLAHVAFGLLNFPGLHLEQDKIEESNGSFRRVGAVQLKADSWVVDISVVPDFSEVKKDLDATGGYGITHVGTITRSDGSEFSVSEVEQLLHGLTLFLSFARGAYCGLTLVKGNSRDGQVAWERWGTSRVTGWFRAPSWFDWHHGHVLAELFPCFWQQFQQQEQNLRTLITLYLDSNLGSSHGVGQDGGLILTQAALERLADTLDGKKTGQRIAKTLLKNGISENALPIPPDSCPELAQLAAKHSWKHGPHALVEIRNTIVHPHGKYGKISERAYYEAWNLGQWYLELLLLNRFGAGGGFEYGPRLTQKWLGQVEPLGQWLVENMPRGTDLELPSRDEPQQATPFISEKAG